MMYSPPLTPVHGQPQGTQPWDAEACSSDILPDADAATPPRPISLALANAGENNLGDVTIEAATDDVNHTPSSQATSAERRLKSFIERVTKRR